VGAPVVPEMLAQAPDAGADQNRDQRRPQSRLVGQVDDRPSKRPMNAAWGNNNNTFSGTFGGYTGTGPDGGGTFVPPTPAPGRDTRWRWRPRRRPRQLACWRRPDRGRGLTGGDRCR
jgi:hypothetical protein